MQLKQHTERIQYLIDQYHAIILRTSLDPSSKYGPKVPMPYVHCSEENNSRCLRGNVKYAEQTFVVVSYVGGRGQKMCEILHSGAPRIIQTIDSGDAVQSIELQILFG